MNLGGGCLVVVVIIQEALVLSGTTRANERSHLSGSVPGSVPGLVPGSVPGLCRLCCSASLFLFLFFFMSPTLCFFGYKTDLASTRMSWYQEQMPSEKTLWSCGWLKKNKNRKTGSCAHKSTTPAVTNKYNNYNNQSIKRITILDVKERCSLQQCLCSAAGRRRIYGLADEWGEV